MVKVGGKLAKKRVHRHDGLMQTNHTANQMDASLPFCPNEACCARGLIGQGNIRLHDRERQRYRCRVCQKTFSARRGTMMEGLRSPETLVVIVVTLLSYGCPRQAVVHAFGLDERTIACWQQRAGKQCQRVHQAIVEQGKLSLQHVQADELRAKGRKLIVWMAFALDATTRLFLAGTVSERRDSALADRLFEQVRACCRRVAELLVCTDGWNAYPNSIMRAFRDKVKTTPGIGRCSKIVWEGLCIATVIKRTEKMRVVEVTRELTEGAMERAKRLLEATAGCKTFNTALIERFNGTIRERLASLTRKCRHAAQKVETLEKGMYLIGSTYNFCFAHHELSKASHFGCPTTPAMAAGLTDHLWSLRELLRYQVAPRPWSQQELAFMQRERLIAEGKLQRSRGRPRKFPSAPPALPKPPQEVL